MTLGQTIAKLRREKRLKQSELAEKLGVTQSIVAKWESDKFRPRPQVAQELSEVLGLSLTDFDEQESPTLQAPRPIIKEIIQRLPELADDQLEALRVVVRDMLMRGKMTSALQAG